MYSLQLFPSYMQDIYIYRMGAMESYTIHAVSCRPMFITLGDFYSLIFYSPTSDYLLSMVLILLELV